MTTKADILRAIRRKCLDCTCHQPSEIRDCRIESCSLWPFRLGSDPEPSKSRGFAKRDGYTGDLSDEAPVGPPVALTPRSSPNPSSIRGIFERGASSPPDRA